MNFLKNHPFAVEAFFEKSIVVTYAVPKEQLIRLIPECLELDTFQDKWAFLAVALVQTKDLRPKGFPRFLGNDFFLIGYRIFVRYKTNKGKNIRGLYILKSETDSKKMEVLGNIFTHYSYSTIDINIVKNEKLTTMFSINSGFELTLDEQVEEIGLPVESPFSNFKEARRFAGPLPHTFHYDDKSKKVVIVEGVREHWEPKPIQVQSVHFDFINSMKLSGVFLANSFEINQIPYFWKKGRTEKWI
ncbi:MAG: DUF2071 domain-containing protein [Bacteroidia bacterium]|nr:DUF2071 domain-containing protein [Bacteroidia bacterium]